MLPSHNTQPLGIAFDAPDHMMIPPEGTGYVQVILLPDPPDVKTCPALPTPPEDTLILFNCAWLT